MTALLVLAVLLALLHKAFELVLTNEYATWAPGLARLLVRTAGFICPPRRRQWWADLSYVQREEKTSGLLQAGWCFLSSPTLAIRHAVARLRAPQRQPSGGLSNDEVTVTSTYNEWPAGQRVNWSIPMADEGGSY